MKTVVTSSHSQSSLNIVKNSSPIIFYTLFDSSDGTSLGLEAQDHLTQASALLVFSSIMNFNFTFKIFIFPYFPCHQECHSVFSLILVNITMSSASSGLAFSIYILSQTLFHSQLPLSWPIFMASLVAQTVKNPPAMRET